MMRFTALFLTSLLASTNAFAPSPAYCHPSTKLAMTELHNVGSGMTYKDIPMLIKNLSDENFDSSLEMLQPLLADECVGDICDGYILMLHEKADAIGQTIPSDFIEKHH